MRKNRKNIIEVQEETIIEQDDQKITLEKGDRIRILESTEVSLKEYKFKKTGTTKDVSFEYLFDNPDGDNFWIKEDYDLKKDKFTTFKKFEDFDLYTIEGKPLKIWFDNRIKEDIRSAKQKVEDQQEKNWKVRADFYQKNVIDTIRSGTPEFRELEIFPNKRDFVENYMHPSHIRVNFEGSKGYGYIRYAFEQWDDKRWNLYQRGYNFSNKYYKRLSSALNKFIKTA